MTGILNLLAGVSSVIKDTYFNLTTLLLPGNGTNGAQNNTFLDSSSNNFTITRNGNTTQGTFSPFSQTGWSNYFDGTGDYLATPANAAFNVGTSSFTLEAWIYPTNFSSTRALFSFADSNVFYFNTSGIPVYGIFGTSDTTIGSTAVSVNTWTHVAFVRSGSTLTCYLNGVSAGSITTSSSIGNSTSGNSVGQHRTGNYFFGYISNLRLVNGAAIYTSGFTPSTSPLTTTSQGASASQVELLTCQSNRFIDNSDNAFALTAFADVSVQAFSPFAPTAAYSAATNGGSGYFDGSGDYLTYPDNAVFQFGTGDFTAEAWVYPTATPSVNYTHIVGSQEFGLNGTWLLGIDTNLNLRIFASALNGTGSTTANGGTVPLNAWSYVAIVRSGSTLKGYINGVEVCSVSNSANVNSAGYVGSIGADNNGDESVFTGYISSVRVVKGGALTVTSVPTSPFTTTVSSGTVSLLANFTNAGITDATAKNDLETVGNAQISTTQSKFGGSSMYFDGTGDWLLGTPSVNNDFGTGNFTIEAWIYMTSTSNYFYIYNSSNANFNSPNFAFLYDISLGLRMYAHAGTHTVNQGSTSGWSANTWYYVALVRNGGTITIYRDGVSLASGSTFSGVSFGSSTALTQIGGSSPDSRSNNGYIDELRVTKGYARTVTSVPTAAFPLQ